MARIESQAVKTMAEEIVKAMKKVVDSNNVQYVNNQIQNYKVVPGNISSTLNFSLANMATLCAQNADLSENATIVLALREMVISTAPENPVDGQFWLDISSSPSVLKIYNATTEEWEIINDTSALQEGINTVSARVDIADTEIAANTYQISLRALTAEVNEEFDIITDDISGITSVLTNADSHTEVGGIDISAQQIASAVSSTHISLDGTNTTLASAIVQNADRISLVVSSPTGQSELVFTDNAISVLSQNVDITADKFATHVGQDETISSISQQADRIDLVITGDSTASEVTITEAAINAISDQIDIKAEKINAIADEIDLYANDSLNIVVGDAINDVRIGSRNYVRNSKSIEVASTEDISGTIPICNLCKCGQVICA